ncbi:hypothetical protein [Streptomyces sp. NPDC056105]|uniref:hypothetical protein n=1 Tax=Streptomyces sp. NPDC056105 TaxID=3345714 RepID=UPI0035DDE89E
MQRQYSGTAGRIENSHVAVYLGYSVAAMPDQPKRPLSELLPGECVQATITSHQPWGITAKLNEDEPVGASLDTIRRRSEPSVRLLAKDLPPVGTTVELVVGEVRSWHDEPWVWVDLTSN